MSYRRVSKRYVPIFVLALAILSMTMLSLPVHAQAEHQLLRRMAVFPLNLNKDPQVNSRDFRGDVSAQAVDDAWWQIREQLTQSRRFLVASKQFLQKSDAFQPRGELAPADAILLGRLLDAHALVTTELESRALRMRVYDGGNGLLLWQKELMLHPSRTVSDQIAESAGRLIRDFIASIPYQAYQYVDPLIGKAMYQEGNTLLAQVDVGINSRAKPGDLVQWIQIDPTRSAPLFQGGAQTMVYADGKIIKIEQGIAIVEVSRMTKGKELMEFALVRLPREAERLAAEYLLDKGIKGNISVEIVAPEISPAEQFRKENRPLMTTLSWVGSLAALLLLAF